MKNDKRDKKTNYKKGPLCIILIAIFAFVSIFVGLLLANRFSFTKLAIELNNDIPRFMKTQPSTDYDREVADRLVQELESKYGINFTLIGVYYDEYRTADNRNTERRVRAAYAYSDEHPQVYVANYIDDKDSGGNYVHQYAFDNPHWDKYLESVNAYNYENTAYEKAKELNLNPDAFVIEVVAFTDDDDIIGATVWMNSQKMELDALKYLLQSLRDTTGKKELRTTVFVLNRGNKQELKDFVRDFSGVGGDYLKDHFGQYEKRQLVFDAEGVAEKQD